MLQVTLLGSGGMVPLPGRPLSSLLVRYKGSGVLIDCGEGTQVALREAGLGFRRIDIICLTHFHADHVAGLPGLLLTIGNTGRTEPLTVIGPAGVEQVVNCLRVIAPQLPYEVRCQELGEAGGVFFKLDGLTLSACPVEHWIPCYAYRFDLERSRRFEPERARDLGVPVKVFKALQQGKTIWAEGKEITPTMVLGPPRKGVRLCYATDLRPSRQLVDFAEKADLFICEGMYGDSGQWEKAVEHRHCLFAEAAQMAKEAGARELWLTHFSPSMPEPGLFIGEAEKIFANVCLEKRVTELRFEN